ncbi:MAG TPA: hypothetical protein VI585_13960 [Candidatus Binatia bacterium]
MSRKKAQRCGGAVWCGAWESALDHGLLGRRRFDGLPPFAESIFAATAL